MVEKPPEGIDWKAFSTDLSVSGMSFDAENRVVGLLIGGSAVSKAAMPGYVRRQLARALVMEGVASGKAPKTSALSAQVEKERAEIVAELEAKYG
jgi:hypothetical protein